MNDYIIREATIDDADASVIYTKKIGSESDNVSFGKEGRFQTREEEIQRIQERIDLPGTVIYLAVKDNEIIGEATLTGMSRRMSHVGELGITVLKEYWNQGIATALIKKIIEFALDNNIEIITLSTRCDNAGAIHLYKKFNFKKVGVIPAFLKVNHNYYDFDMMVLDLREK